MAARSKTVRLSIAILIPCYNEVLTLEKSLNTWLDQSRPADQILVVDDGSTDGTDKVLDKFRNLKKFSHKKKYRNLEIIRIPHKGNKSFVQQEGLKHIKTDIFITTDADSLAHHDFVKRVELAFSDPAVEAFSGYVQSLPGNWLTACREIEYTIGQDLHKQAQHNMGFVFVIPGCAGAFRTELFRQLIHFDHDTITEDLDFTYVLNENGVEIFYDTRAVIYTQDPPTLSSYIRQVSRWISGGYQNLLKHNQIIYKPNRALELSLMYVEGLIFSILMLTSPFISMELAVTVFQFYMYFAIGMGIYTAIRRKRLDVFIYSPYVLFLNYLNAAIFVERFVVEIIFRKHNNTWFHPERRAIS